MAGFLVPLADAVVAALNAGDFALTFTATRVYDPLRPVESLGTLRVDVVMGDVESEPLDRARQREQPRVDVCIRQRIDAPAGSEAETSLLDELVALVESIQGLLSAPAQRVLTLEGGGNAHWLKAKLIVPFIPKKLREERLFYSLVRLTYLVVTDGT